MTVIEQYSVPGMKRIKSIHFVGIGGSGMSSIAKYLKQKGHDVEGYDQRISYITNLLENDGVKTYQNLDNYRYEKEVLYIISSAINLDGTFLKNFKIKFISSETISI